MGCTSASRRGGPAWGSGGVTTLAVRAFGTVANNLAAWLDFPPTSQRKISTAPELYSGGILAMRERRQ